MTDFHKNIQQCVDRAENASTSAGANSGVVKGVANAAGAIAWALADLADAIRSTRKDGA